MSQDIKSQDLKSQDLKSELTKLYGTPLSLYAGKVRSYLIKAGIEYAELATTSKHYVEEVLPQAGSRTVPVIETANGEVIRDGTAIIDYFESLSGQQFSPLGPKQRLVSRLSDVLGAEGLLRPAMHYRWDFPEQNADFVAFHFETMVPADRDRKALAAKTMARMQSAGQSFGAVPENFQVIEDLYEELLDKLNDHFSDFPYLLGTKPCIGDFGLIAPLYGHLGRDPAPLQLMQTRAVRLFRWVERMNRPEWDIGEFAGDLNGALAPAYLDNDEIPASLQALMTCFAEDFVPETLAAKECINDWLADQEDIKANTPILRSVGFAGFKLRGQEVNAIAQPYRFYLLKRVQDEYEAMNASDKAAMQSMLEACGMAEVLDAKLSREIGRKDNLEVWL